MHVTRLMWRRLCSMTAAVTLTLAVFAGSPSTAAAGPTPVYNAPCYVGSFTATMPLPAPGVLARADTLFTLDNTRRFLVSFSYFGAKYEANLANVRTTMRTFRCKGFNAVRIFADWWNNNQYCQSTSFDTNPLIPASGPTLNTVAKDKLISIIQIAKEEGLVVDLAFAMEVVQGLTFDRYRAGIAAFGQALADAGHKHVMFDVQNEYNVPVGSGPVPCKFDGTLYPDLMAQLVTAGRTGNASRVVMASWSNNAQAQVSPWAYYLGLSALAVHECRTYGSPGNCPGGYPGYWYNPSLAQIYIPGMQAVGWRFPLFMQEPDRWVDNSWGLPYSGANTLTSQNIIDSAGYAIIYGAAGWTFHTESLFWPHLPGLRRWDGNPTTPSAVQQNVLDSIWSYVGFVQACWGKYSPVGWLPADLRTGFCPV